MDILGLRHRPSGLNTHFVGGGMSFAAYVQRTQEMLRQAHEWKNDGEQIIAGNSPFELLPTGSFEKGNDKPYRRGILLTHGLTDSPYQMRHLAAFFQRMGFRVMAPLLPGHGTQPGDLLKVRWKEWRKAVNFGASRLAEEVDELYLGGLSAGAALSVLQSAKDKRVRGLFLFSPAFEIDIRAKWANLHRFYSRWVPKEAWLNVMQDRDKYKYESFCKNAAAQMYALTQALPRAGLKIPLFAAASADDVTVSASATLGFMDRARHAGNRLVWYATQKPDHQNIEWVNSAVPGQHILSSAHTAIVIPPEDEHYGANGDYVNCLHYYENDKTSYHACCARGPDTWLGEATEQNLRHGVVRRLTYNPHYAALEASMQNFIAGLP
ncbi:MAG: alpha/beta fold hydrolase [Nitrosomonadales bacterium]|nr:alpha/beta fold hydrolase [Nitrosomonadales bacterium]